MGFSLAFGQWFPKYSVWWTRVQSQSCSPLAAPVWPHSHGDGHPVCVTNGHWVCDTGLLGVMTALFVDRCSKLFLQLKGCPFNVLWRLTSSCWLKRSASEVWDAIREYSVTCLLLLTLCSPVPVTMSYGVGAGLPCRHLSTWLLFLLVQQNKALTSLIADSVFQSSCGVYGRCWNQTLHTNSLFLTC